MSTPSFLKTPLFTLTLAACALPALAPRAQAQAAASTVVYVSSGDVVVKRSSDGKLLNYSVTSSTTVSVDGKKVPASGLTAGTKLTDALPGTPKAVAGVTIVKGKVYQVDPPDGVTLSLASGIKELVVPIGTNFTVGGKTVDINKLEKGMEVEATVLTLADSTATATTPASVPPQAGTILLAEGADEAKLPDAGTNQPLYGILGLTVLALGLGLRFLRPASTQA